VAIALLSNHPVLGSITKDQLDRIEKGAWYHSIDLPDGRIIPGIIPVEALRARMDAFGLPVDLRGKRVLDVGAATGWCSFEMERRGADVVAVDCVEYDDFRVAHRILDSKVDYKLLDVDELTPEFLGTFDIVLFFGVLYHLRHPLLGLERVLALARDTVLVESFVCDGHLSEAERVANGCYMEFYETDELGGQIDNWVGPTANCLAAMCRSAGFVRVERKYIQEHRAGIVCRRTWENSPAEAATPPPVIGSAVNNRTGDVEFHPGKDEYICLYFRAAKNEVNRNDLRVEIDGLGVPVLTISSHGGERWQANLRLPARLGNGPHSIRLRLVDSGFGEAATFYCGDRPTGTSRASIPKDVTPALYRVSNGLSETREFFGHRSEYLCCCFHLGMQQPEREDIVIEVGGFECAPSFVGSAEGWGPDEGWQANVKVPGGLKPGSHAVRVRLNGAEAFSNSMEITLNTSGTPA
jgi:tRNA (mo5U34)-methyltransferase